MVYATHRKNATPVEATVSGLWPSVAQWLERKFCDSKVYNSILDLNETLTNLRSNNSYTHH